MAPKRPPRGGKKSKKAAQSQRAIKGWETRRANRAMVSWQEFGIDFPGYHHGRKGGDDRERRKRRGDEEEDIHEGPVWEEDWEWDY